MKGQDPGKEKRGRNAVLRKYTGGFTEKKGVSPTIEVEREPYLDLIRRKKKEKKKKR